VRAIALTGRRGLHGGVVLRQRDEDIRVVRIVKRPRFRAEGRHLVVEDIIDSG